MVLKFRITTDHSFSTQTGVNLVQGFLNLDFENRLRPSWCQKGIFSWLHIVFQNAVHNIDAVSKQQHTFQKLY